jgi:hypothetical protein
MTLNTQSISNLILCEKEINFLLNKFNDKIVIVAHVSGYAGSLVYRILAADNKFYWSKGISGVLTEESYYSIKWPDNTEGFRTYDPDNRTGKLLKTQHLATCHVQIPLVEDANMQDIIEYYKIISASNKKLLLRTHLMNIRALNNDIKIVRIIGSLPDRFNGNNYKNINVIAEDHINTYNLNINNLLSINYDIFLSEYLSLCNYYKIEPVINSVRSFILMWLDKQTRGNSKLPSC